jgi:Periplasmic binding protein domain
MAKGFRSSASGRASAQHSRVRDGNKAKELPTEGRARNIAGGLQCRTHLSCLGGPGDKGYGQYGAACETIRSGRLACRCAVFAQRIDGGIGIRSIFSAPLAIQEINDSGGILGREVEVVAYDPGSAPETYRKMADRLLTEDGVSVIFGCSTSAERKAVLPAIERRGKGAYPVNGVLRRCARRHFLASADTSLRSLGMTSHETNSEIDFDGCGDHSRNDHVQSAHLCPRRWSGKYHQ